LLLSQNTELFQEYIKECKRVEEDAVYSSKGHYNAAARWQSIHIWVGLPNATLAAVAGVSAFKEQVILAGVLSILVATIAAIITFLNPERKGSLHNNAAGQYHQLRNQARIFQNITMRRSQDVQHLQQEFETLTDKRDKLNIVSPQIPEWAFKKARIGIEAGEATHKD
jgi:hypothetical protein